MAYSIIGKARIIDWGYFNKFEELTEKYLPAMGEGESKATQIVTAVCKLVYKWYNDGDVFDNTHGLDGWCNDLSSYANWLRVNTTKGAMIVLDSISDCYTGEDYENLLADLSDELLRADYLERMNAIPADGTIYNCDGPYKFEDHDWDEDEEDW